MVPEGEWPCTVAVHMVCWPTVRAEGVQTTVVEVVTGKMLRVTGTELLGKLFVSPEYDAVICAPPAPLADTAT